MKNALKNVFTAIVALIIVVMMVVPAFAAETPSQANGRTNVVAGLTPVLIKGDGTETTLGSNGARLTDGNLADNKANHCDGKWDSKGSTDARGGAAPATYANTPSVVMKVDGADKNYFYAIRLDLPTAVDVDGFTLYVQAYKRIVMDRGFEILVSADGTNWTKVYSAKVADTLTHADYNAVYAGIPDRDSGDPTDESALSITSTFTKQTGVKYVAYACTMYREMNGYYTGRFTEFELYAASATTTAAAGTTAAPATTTAAPATTTAAPATTTAAPATTTAAPAPATGDNSVNYVIIVAAAIAVAAAAVVATRKKEND